MAFQLNWLQQERILLARFDEEATTADMMEISTEYTFYLSQIRQTVHGIFDIRAVDRYPQNTALLRPQLQRIGVLNSGIVIIVGGDESVTHVFSSALAQIMPMKTTLRIVESMEDALVLLQSHDPTVEVA